MVRWRLVQACLPAKNILEMAYFEQMMFAALLIMSGLSASF